MNRLRATSRKHVQQRVFLGVNSAVLLLGLFPVGFFRRLALLYLVVLGGLWIFFSLMKRQPLDYLIRLWWVYKVEEELLRSDFVWREISSDLQKGRSLVELPAVSIVKADEVIRVIGIKNSVKYQDRLLKSDFSAVFPGWVMTDIALNDDKSLVLLTMVKQGANLGYRFDTMKEVKAFARRHPGVHLPIDRIEGMKSASHALLVGKTGSGKSFALVYLLLYYLSNGWAVVIADPKNSDLALLGRSFGLRVATTADEIVQLVEDAYQQMEKRKIELKGRQKFGKTASEQGYSNIMVIIDEYASLSLKMDKKQNADLLTRVGNLVLEGRQLSVHVTLCMQQANAQVVPTSIREQLGNKIVMGASDEQTYVTAFGQSSASEVLDMAMKPGQAWLMTEGKTKPVFVRLPWLSEHFSKDIDKFIEKKRLEQDLPAQSNEFALGLPVKSDGQLMP